MSDPIVLPAKLPSSAVGELAGLLTAETETVGEAREVRIDGSCVLSVGALAAEHLLRFVRSVEAGGGQVAITTSADFESDLKLLGLHDLLLGKDLVT